LTSIRDAESLKQCIGQLPQAQKDSFLLKEEAGLTVKDIATILNISFEASKSRLRYAYVNLRQCLYVKTGRAV
jgi:RNA polymerase sigma-70 factor (ECF subfamily)